MTDSTVEQNETTPQSEENLSEKFSETLNQFIANSYQLFARVEEMEKAIAYLLSKDKEWMAAFNASLAQQENQPGMADGKQVIIPDSD